MLDYFVVMLVDLLFWFYSNNMIWFEDSGFDYICELIIIFQCCSLIKVENFMDDCIFYNLEDLCYDIYKIEV